jgi:Tfp pilus assembly protein PilN
MIKINLLGVAAPKPKLRAVAPVSKAMQMGTLLGALVVSFAIVGLFYLIWNRSIDTLNVELKKQQAEAARLAAIKQENARYEQERGLLEQRVKTIQVLQASREGPTEFLNTLGDVVNKTTSDLYLVSVAPQGDRVVIHGQAASVNSVATFLSSMKTSGYFTDVQLRQFYEDDVQNLLNYKFNIDCSLKIPAAAASPMQAGAGGRATASPARAGGGAGAATSPRRPRF